METRSEEFNNNKYKSVCLFLTGRRTGTDPNRTEIFAAILLLKRN